jgi:creatinine amidohydrolase/Fe(II)-dependent formamide hydrolase-like protein
LFPLIFAIRTINQGCKSWGVTKIVVLGHGPNIGILQEATR